MNQALRQILNRYTGTLKSYLDRDDEAALHAAYELGRKAVASGFGVLDMAQVHLQATTVVLKPLSVPGTSRDHARAIENFFMEALSPFEAHHRGFQQASLQLGELSRQVLQAQEQERHRISRELHDEVGQALTVANMNLELMKREAAECGGGLVGSLEDTQGLLIQTMDTVRRFSHELRPPMLEELGLIATLRASLRGFGRRTGIRTRFRADDESEHLPAASKIVIYRVVQESLTNACKHASASLVDVRLQRTKEGFRLTVRDNGVGLAAPPPRNGAHPRGGIGITGMQERLRLVKGTFCIESCPGRGTAIRAVVPFASGS